MANIIPLQEDTGAQFYPQTHVKAVIDSEGNTLDEILENLEPGGSTSAVKYTPQTLTTAQKTQARTNIDAPSTADVSGKQDTLVSGTNIKTVNGESLLGSGNIVAGDPNAVKYTSQTLTDAQKAQARTNIGAGTSDFSGNPIVGLSTPSTTDGTLVAILANGDTITIDLNHNHSQYLKYEYLEDESEMPATPEDDTLYLIAEESE